jgi:hypothetical protein
LKHRVVLKEWGRTISFLNALPTLEHPPTFVAWRCFLGIQDWNQSLFVQLLLGWKRRFIQKAGVDIYWGAQVYKLESSEPCLVWFFDSIWWKEQRETVFWIDF